MKTKIMTRAVDWAGLLLIIVSMIAYLLAH